MTRGKAPPPLPDRGGAPGAPAGNGAFEGLRGRLAAAVMARANRDMEAAALDLLAPQDGERILVLGYGPGVGINLLLERCRPAGVVAVDPSTAMAAVARRRLRRQAGGAAVSLVVGDVTALGPDVAGFDGAVAVNCHQLWGPLGPATAAVAARIGPAGRLVSLTHDWAIARVAPVEEWRDQASVALRGGGLGALSWGGGQYRSGPGTWVVARRPAPCPPGEGTPWATAVGERGPTATGGGLRHEE